MNGLELALDEDQGKAGTGITHFIELNTVCGSVDWPSTAKTNLPSCSTSFTSIGGISSSESSSPLRPHEALDERRSSPACAAP